MLPFLVVARLLWFSLGLVTAVDCVVGAWFVWCFGSGACCFVWFLLVCFVLGLGFVVCACYHYFAVWLTLRFAVFAWYGCVVLG